MPNLCRTSRRFAIARCWRSEMQIAAAAFPGRFASTWATAVGRSVSAGTPSRARRCSRTSSVRIGVASRRSQSKGSASIRLLCLKKLFVLMLFQDMSARGKTCWSTAAATSTPPAADSTSAKAAWPTAAAASMSTVCPVACSLIRWSLRKKKSLKISKIERIQDLNELF